MMDDGSNQAGINAIKQVTNAIANLQKSIDAQTVVLNAVLPTIQTLATTAGSSAGKYANVTFNGVAYKIALLNP